LAAQLTLRGISKAYAHHAVLDRVSFSVRPGERVGVVGDNGCGKTTLLRLMAGLEPPDDGQVTAVAGGGVGYLGQTLGLPAHDTVQSAVDRALAELRTIERRLHELEIDLTEERVAEYGDLLTRFEARGGYEADARVERALHGLGLAHIDRDRTIGSLSGGEQARLGLACLLAAAPELLLLDEPTNHLDESSMTWLEQRLREHGGTVVIVSHDRIFLDRVATAILEIEDGTVTRFGGGYSGFLDDKAAARQRAEQAYADWCEEIERVTAFASTTAHRVAPGRAMKDRNKMAYGTGAGRVQSSISGRVRQAQERLRRLTEHPVPRPPEPLRFAGSWGTGQGGVAELHQVRVGGRLEITDLIVRAGDRLLIHGPNGAGKSTLLGVLAGCEPDSGAVRRPARIGHLAQEVTFARPDRTVLDTFIADRAGYREEHRAGLLAFGLFRPDALDLAVGSLSVGQRRRLALATLLASPHDLLLLDEPTNHLSLTLVEELEQALDEYQGALVIVSHDRALRRRFTGTEREMRDGCLV
jgi:macrolide transport system ATP-binding/permease protein